MASKFDNADEVTAVLEVFATLYKTANAEQKIALMKRATELADSGVSMTSQELHDVLENDCLGNDEPDMGFQP